MDPEQVSAQEDLQDLTGLPPLETEDLGKGLPPDPGLSEGMPKQVRKDEPPEEHPRFKQIYKKMKDNEREAEDLKKTIAEQAKDIELARKEFSNLVATASTKKETDQVDQEISGIRDQIRQLRSIKIDARKNMDIDREFQVDDQIEDLKEKLESRKLAVERSKITKEVQETATQGSVNNDVAQWVVETKWFNQKSKEYNPLMAGAAKELDMMLTNDREWGEEPVRVRLDEVKRRVEEQFGVKKQKVESRNNIPIVEGIGLTSPPNRSGTIQLTEDQKRVARRFHPELEAGEAEKQYAQSLKIIQSRNG